MDANLRKLGGRPFRALGRGLRSWKHAAVDLLFPPSCAYCRADIEPLDDRLLLCVDCRAMLLPYAGPLCRKCGTPVTYTERDPQDCPHCRGRGFRFDSVVPLGTYQASFRTAIVRMKHFHEQPLANAMGKLLARRLDPVLVEHPAHVILPVPIHWSRRMSRGTSSPEVMAEAVAHELRIPIELGVLTSLRKTDKQSLLSPPQRRRNVRNAFRIVPDCSLSGLHVVLVDDVVTTGATANESAKVLKRAGASRVTVATVARAIGTV